MANHVLHFAIHADDCQRAKQFYERVFGWQFEPWGPPEFWQIHTGEGGIRGALQKRSTPVTGQGMNGFECTIGVEDVAQTAAAIAEHGGEVTMNPLLIEGVGTLIHFRDPEGNAAGAMQYLPGVMD